MIDISVRFDVKALNKKLDALASKQLPFATAQAINATLKIAQEAERENMRKMLDRPTPFTVNSVAVKRADKRSLTGRVYVKDIAAAYLEPFEDGGTHKLPGSGRTWLNPKDKSLLNQYGNFARNKLASMRGRSDTFIGAVKTKSGEEVSGLWQRPVIRKNQKVRGKSVVRKGPNITGKLKLLMRFGDPIAVKQKLGYRETAQRIVAKHFQAELKKAMDAALKTAK